MLYFFVYLLDLIFWASDTSAKQFKPCLEPPAFLYVRNILSASVLWLLGATADRNLAVNDTIYYLAKAVEV